MQLKYQKFDLPLKHVFTISRGSVIGAGNARRPARGRWQVWLRRGDDEFVLRRDDSEYDVGDRVGAVGLWKNGSLDGPLQLIDRISRKLPKERYAKFALNAIDQAIHDLWGKLRGSPVYRMWGLTIDKIPDVGLHARASTRRRRWSPR